MTPRSSLLIIDAELNGVQVSASPTLVLKDALSRMKLQHDYIHLEE
jgi:hypothetical protein